MKFILEVITTLIAKKQSGLSSVVKNHDSTSCERDELMELDLGMCMC